MKALGGCENLKAQAVRNANLANEAAVPGGETLKGTKPQGRRCLLAFDRGQASGFWETGDSRQQLGAWPSSEEEPKPMRGSRESFTGFSGAWNVKTLQPNLNR
jgi:hypothetical protein